ncbi:MAG: flippase-like domain-containing protein [Acidimicrobiia bacterium]|nr:flippase-like domain-containing protein [Acidimicrobiia bacterium]
MEARVEQVEHEFHLPTVKLQTVLSLVVLALAIHVLLPQVGELRHSVNAIKRADPRWVPLALVTTALTFVFASVALRAAACRPLPFAKTVIAQLASSFANRLAPGSVGGLGVNERFLTRAGEMSNAQASTALALNGVAGVIVHITFLFLTALAAAGHTGTRLPHPRHWELAAGFALILFVAGVIWYVPRLRTHIIPAIKDGWAELSELVKRPSEAATLFAGAAGITASYTVTFLICLAALHVHISLAQGAFVYLGGAVVSSVAPTPGGLGAMEAALVAGLTHVGVLDGKAVASVLTFRLLTYWLPILPGYLSLRYLRRSHLL